MQGLNLKKKNKKLNQFLSTMEQLEDNKINIEEKLTVLSHYLDIMNETYSVFRERAYHLS